jgi:uncharacterized protein YceK
VSNVVDLAFMFADATLCNQSLGNWNVSSDTALASIFEGSGCPGEVGQECCFDDCGFEPEVVYDCSDLLSGCSTVRHFESRTRVIRNARERAGTTIKLYDGRTAGIGSERSLDLQKGDEG